jgi:hypothetical protein
MDGNLGHFLPEGRRGGNAPGKREIGRGKGYAYQRQNNPADNPGFLRRLSV